MREDDQESGVRAGQAGAPIFAEATYEYADGQWRWTPEMFALLGLRDDGEDPYALIFARMAEADRAGVAALLSATVRSPGPFAGQYRMRDDEGREHSIAFVGDVDRDDSGAPVRLRGLAFDVSRAARQAAAEAVAAATQDRAAIEQVKGALMFAYGLDADAAFGLLSRYSQRGNVKLAVVARRAADLLVEQTTPGTEGSLLRVLEVARESLTAPVTDVEGAAG